MPYYNISDYLDSVKKILNVVQRTNASVIYSNQEHLGPYLSAVKLLSDTTTVVHIRGQTPPEQAFALQLILQDRIIFNSQFMCDTTLSEGKIDWLSRSTSHVVYNAVELPDVSNISPVPEYDNEGITIGMFGRCVPWKNFKFVFDAITDSSLYSEIGALMLVGINSGLGDDKYEAEIKDIASRRDPQDKFKLIGFQDDIWPYYMSCDIVVVPSIKEPFGRVPIEAGALGKAVLASNSGGFRETIQDDETGLLFELSVEDSFLDKLGELVDDEALRNKLGEQLKRDVNERFSAERYYDDMAEILEVNDD
ncbi:glycosyltransferase family 4 protein [Halosimplex sp. TS25]|uniref:glycosyltransferase family 4 protein n=1 Tax=Halosimplex rarum TaxID=3396619 RepID=UPI0039EB366A